MNIDKTTCWYDTTNSLYNEMSIAIKNHLEFDNIDHGKILIELINLIPEKNLNFLDLGCGGALCHKIANEHKYTGADLNHVIENVSKYNFPHLEFISCDIIENDLSFLKNYDIVLMNAIVDVMEFPLLILNKVLSNCKNYVIIHRQEISNRYLTNGFTLLKSESYGGFTYRTIIERKAFNKILKENNFSIIKELDSGLGIYNNKSLLLKKEC